MLADSDEQWDLGRNREHNPLLIDLSRRELIDSLDRHRIAGRGVIIHPATVSVSPRKGGVRHESDDRRGQDKGRHDLGEATNSHRSAPFCEIDAAPGIAWPRNSGG